ncbi:MAG: hypothetical protein LBQ66_08275 [Planctomycetaceae bacterium]|nr:hypothetical protein [Planctomycetaceae bacterium]
MRLSKNKKVYETAAKPTDVDSQRSNIYKSDLVSDCVSVCSEAALLVDFASAARSCDVAFSGDCRFGGIGVGKKSAKGQQKISFRSALLSIFLFSVLLLVRLFFGFDATAPVYADEQAVQSAQAKSKPTLTNPAKSQFYPTAVVNQITKIAANDKEEMKPLSDWAKNTITIIDDLIWGWERREFDVCEKRLEAFQKSVYELDSLRKSMKIFKVKNSDFVNTAKKAGVGIAGGEVDLPAESEAALESELESAVESDQESVSDYVPRAIAVEELLYGLERRYVFWKLALAVETGEGFPVAALLDKSKNKEHLDKLAKLTADAEKFLLNNKRKSPQGERIGELWSKYLDTKPLLDAIELHKRIISSDKFNQSHEEQSLASVCSLINVILYRFEDVRLTKQQVVYLRSPLLRVWRVELESWGADTVSPTLLLRDIESYESQIGMSDMRNLYRSASRMAFSKSEAARRFGLITHDIYGGSNVKFYISKVLINHLLPTSEKEVKPFREYIQNQCVVGQREADFDLKVNLIPDAERLLLSLDVAGSISSVSQANAFATKIYNRGEAKCTAQKQIELTEEGFQLSPTDVTIESNKIQLRGIKTDFDGMPILSHIMRSIVMNQYEARRADAKKEAGRKIERQVRQRIDYEAEKGLIKANDKFEDLREVSSMGFGITVEKKNSVTEEHWLLTSWAIRSPDTLSGNTPAPETLSGSFADIKVHESAINTILSKLDFAGKTDTVGNFRQLIADRFRHQGITEDSENNNVIIGFDKYNPIVVRFVDGVIELVISIDSLKIERQNYRDFQVYIKYEPVRDENGKLVLKRQGVISIAKTKFSSQIALRAIFGKIFPEDKTFPLTPKFLNSDERFEGLTTGLCRIGKGWFAIAIVNSASEADSISKTKNNPTTQPKKQLVSEHIPIKQYTR